MAYAFLQEIEREFQEANENSDSVPYFADYSEADPLRDYSDPAENGLKDFNAGV